MLASSINPDSLTDELIDRILFDDSLNYGGKSAKCAIILGSKKAPQYRVPTGAQLYFDGKVKKLIMTGGKVRSGKYGKMPEAVAMKNSAMKLGVPENDILLETQSMNTKENYLCALLPLEREFHLHTLDSVIIITAHYHIRRAMQFAKRYLPNWITPLPCPISVGTTADSWRENSIRRKTVYDEAAKLIWYINEGIIDDFSL